LPPGPKSPYPLAAWIFGGALAWALVLTQARPWLSWDRFFFDKNLRWRHQELPPQHPLIAHVSLKAADLDAWSTTREQYDAVAEVVASCRDQGAAVIVLDLLLMRGKDEDFRQLWSQVYGQDDVVLACSLQELPRLPGPSENLGAANLQRDEDGMFRRYQLYYSGEKRPSLAWLAYLKMKRLSQQAFRLNGPRVEVPQLQTDFPNQLFFQPRTAWSELGSGIQFASLSDLRKWQDAGESRLEGKAVFVGYVAPGVSDVGPTVLDPGYPKVGIHATVLSNLLQHRFYQQPPLAWPVLGGLVAFGLGVCLGWWLRLISPLALGLVLVLVWLPTASQQALWGSFLLPWVSWILAALSGLTLVRIWGYRQWSFRLQWMQASMDFQNPLVFKRLGSYLLVEKLGEGGFGAVYRALPAATLDQAGAVAIKLATRASVKSQDSRRRFLREARICRTLRHPGIVRVLESGEHDGILYYTMEWVRGRSLRVWMLQTRTPQEATAMLLPLLEAVAYAHNQGVLHRDLKPDNVLVGEDGSPRIVDFGLAFDQDSSQMTAAQEVIGTLNYLAPERIEGVSYDARSDQYALGVMGYEMLTGNSPFPEIQHPGQALAWRLTKRPQSLTEVVGSEAALFRIVDRMMAHDPDDRYPTLNEAVAELRQAAGPDLQSTLTFERPATLTFERPE